MKRVFWVLALAAVALPLTAQSYTMGLNKTDKGHSFERFSFPDNIMVFKLDKSKHTLKPEGLTLVHVWTLKSGTQPELWSRIQDIAARYADKGLHTLSVNFENGSDFRRQQKQLEDYFERVPKPENFYFDPLGYVPDFLKTPGFPVYYLVSPEGEVVFHTLGEDFEGVKILEDEIMQRVEKQP